MVEKEIQHQSNLTHTPSLTGPTLTFFTQGFVMLVIFAGFFARAVVIFVTQSVPSRHLSAVVIEVIPSYLVPRYSHTRVGLW